MKIEYEPRANHPDGAGGPMRDPRHRRPIRCYHRGHRDFSRSAIGLSLAATGILLAMIFFLTPEFAAQRSGKALVYLGVMVVAGLFTVALLFGITAGAAGRCRHDRITPNDATALATLIGKFEDFSIAVPAAEPGEPDWHTEEGRCALTNQQLSRVARRMNQAMKSAKAVRQAGRVVVEG